MEYRCRSSGCRRRCSAAAAAAAAAADNFVSKRFNSFAEHHEDGDGAVAASRTGDRISGIFYACLSAWQIPLMFPVFAFFHCTSQPPPSSPPSASPPPSSPPPSSHAFQLILSGKIDPETTDVYSAIMSSSPSVTRHHPDLARGGNSEFVQDFDVARLKTLKFHNVLSSPAAAAASPSSSASSVLRTVSHLVYVDPLSPPGRLLLVETFKARAPMHLQLLSRLPSISSMSLAWSPSSPSSSYQTHYSTFTTTTITKSHPPPPLPTPAPQRPFHRHPPPFPHLHHMLQPRPRRSCHYFTRRSSPRPLHE